MDAQFYSSFGLFCLYAGAAGTAYLAGRIFRGTTRELEVRERVARLRAADSRTDAGTVPDFIPNANGDGGTFTRSNRHRDSNGPGFYLSGYRAARSGAVLRNNLGARPGRHVAGGDPDLSHEETLT